MPWQESIIPPAPTVASPGPGRLVTISRDKNTIEVFWIAPDGAIENARWYEGSTAWEVGKLLPPGTASATGGITAISRSDELLEIFWITPAGGVQQARWVVNRQYPGGIWAVSPVAPDGSASPTSGIGGVSRKPDTKELFFAGAESGLYSAKWYRSEPNWIVTRIMDHAAIDTRISAVCRNSKCIDVVYSQADKFDVPNPYPGPYYYYNPTYDRAMDEDGNGTDSQGNQEYTEYYPPPTIIEAHYRLMVGRWSENEGSAWRMEPLYETKTLSDADAVSRQPDAIEVFYVKHDGAVHHSYWYEGDAHWQHSALTPAKAAAPGTGVAATSRKKDTIEVLWTSDLGHVRGTKWYDGQAWENYDMTGAQGAANAGDVVMVSRIPAALEAFWVGQAGNVTNRHWYE